MANRMLMNTNDALFDHLANAIEHQGYAIVENFLRHADIIALAERCLESDAKGMLKPAAMGRGLHRNEIAALRGDRTQWLTGEGHHPSEQGFLRELEVLRVNLNRRLLLGLQELEMHYALYPPGARYTRHSDCFRDENTRVLSAVCYLNQDWIPAHGGYLRLYLGSGSERFIDIAPRGGTLVLFLAAEFEHEVLTTHQPRMSIVGWFRRRALIP